MDAAPPTHDQLPEDGEGFAAIGRYASASAAHEAGLAVLACGRGYWIREAEGRFELVVEAAYARAMRREVALSAFKNRFWPPRPLAFPAQTASLAPTFGALAILTAGYICQAATPQTVAIGANVAIDAIHGQWWRLATAITLHADLGHLVGNLAGLGFFGHFCGRYFGSGLSWFLIVTAAILANLVGSFAHAGEAYRSIGSSTAVFAALGLLSGYPLGRFLRLKRPGPAGNWVIPLLGGAVLLAWLGGGDGSTDIGAHLLSWLSGFAIAALLAGERIRPGARAQRGLLAGSGLLLAAAWVWAGIATSS